VVKILSRRISALVVVALMAGSCASYRYTRKAEDAKVAENWDAAVYYYLEALASDPGNVSFKMELQRARFKASEGHFQLAMQFKPGGDLARVERELVLAVELDPTHQYAEVELQKVRKDLAVLNQEGGTSKLLEMKKAASEMKVKPPALNPASDEPMSLNFPSPTNVRDIYRAIGQAFGINIMVDPKVRDAKIAIELKNVSARMALENLIQASGHFYKVLDDKTVIVVEDTPQNRRDYEDLVVKTFFLSNGDVKDVNNMLRSLIDARRIAVNESLNSIVIRDTADKVAIAERLINANDKAKAEVLIDVELIQVDSTKLRNIGTSLSSYSFSTSLDPTKLGLAAGAGVPLDRLSEITRGMWSMAIPSITLNLVKSASEAETLAQPQLRITEREKASLVIGDQVPIPVTTFNSSQTVGSNVVPITAFQYKDVGIKIDIEPKVHHNNEVTLKLRVELSEQTGEVTVNGQTQPKFGTRTIDSTIRLKNGETSLLAGLFKYNRRDSSSGIPFLSDLPVIGTLFSAKNRDFRKTDLVLTLTPHIVRNPDITEEDLAPLWVGTESRVTIFGNSPRVQAPATGGSPWENRGGGARGGRDADTPDFKGEMPKIDPFPRRATNPPAVVRRGRIRGGGADLVPTPPPKKGEDVSDSSISELPSDASRPAEVSVYPARLALKPGQDGNLDLFVDPPADGLPGPLNFAYDPARLEVVSVEGGTIPCQAGPCRVEVTHTPQLGWITAIWSGDAVASATIARLRVRPRVVGEIPLIFSGPIGVAVAHNATVLSLPAEPVELLPAPKSP